MMDGNRQMECGVVLGNIQSPLMYSEDELDELLLCEGDHAEAPFHSHDLSSIITDKGCSDRERTREESYEEITKALHQHKKETIELEKELEQLKVETRERCLKQFYQEIGQLNLENKELRRQLKQSKRGNEIKATDKKSERLSNRSGMKVITARGQQNQRTSTKANKNRNNSPNLILRKRENHMTESTSHLGRSQILSPSQHVCKETMLTERKREGGANWGEERDDQMRESLSRNQLTNSVQQGSLFHQMLTEMLNEQKQAQMNQFGELFEERGCEWRPPKNCSHLTELEGQISHCSVSLETLGLVLNRYQKEIKSMNMNLRDVDECTERVMKAKGKLIQMHNQTQFLAPLRQTVKDKELELEEKSKINQEGPQPISSIQTMLKVVSNNPNKSFHSQSKGLYSLYCLQIRQAFKYEKEDQAKRYHKVQKVKETIDSIKQARAKFTQLITIYEQRIAALQQKVQKARVRAQRSANK